ncbi:MAG: ribosomal-processing cysteine protease Prp [Lachnospiraceae bacterium]|jgi:uncharacterized protein YsxB (DUF464 family)|nr:ribosomal-processing cysteine protease Prp [Lachnospiraceae bacterium]
MTKVIFRKTSQGEYRELRCSGHAEYAEKGKDIVCAAVSVLVINTLNSLEELCGLPVRPDTDEENGLIICRFPENMDEKAVVLLDSLVLGCVTIEKQYGKRYCKVKFEEV